MTSSTVFAVALAVALPFTLVPDTTIANAGAVARGTVDEGGDQIQVQVVVPDRIGPGALIMSITTAGEVLQFGPARMLGDRISFDAQLPDVRVTDSRTDAQAAGGGWHLSGRSSEFVSGTSRFGAEHAGWIPEVGPERDGLSAGTPVVGSLRGGRGLAQPATLASATGTGRADSALARAALTLELPIDTHDGIYRATLSLSLFPTD